MIERLAEGHPSLFRFLKHGLVPALFYFAAFCLLTYPLMGRFFTHFFGGQLDGSQNAWNLWWINLAVRHPDQYPSIWQTPLLHWPFGISLRGHTLNPFNGYIGVVLLNFLSLKGAYNTIVVLAVVMSGLTAYWLIYVLTRSWWSALLAGFLFNSSSYMFTHVGVGHMQLVSLEWLPLFLLCWYLLLTRPNILLGIAAAVTLWLVVLCDYYYFFYCVLTAILFFVWAIFVNKGLRFATRWEYLAPLLTFTGLVVLLVGPLVGGLLVSNARDPLTGAHDATLYSLDLLAILIPSRTWLFGVSTASYWSALPGISSESSLYLSLPVFALIAYAWARRKSLEPPARQQLTFWTILLVLFWLFALGPVLYVAGAPVWSAFTPYSLLTRLLPFLGLSGVPARMMAMATLAASVLSAFGFRALLSEWPRTRLFTIALLIVLVFETWPARITTTSATIPTYVNALAALPDDGGVLDLQKTNRGLELFYQTVHGKPLAFGYVSRVPTSVRTGEQSLLGAIAAGDYPTLWRIYRIRYILTDGDLPPGLTRPDITLELIYDRQGTRIYRLGCTCERGE